MRLYVKDEVLATQFISSIDHPRGPLEISVVEEKEDVCFEILEVLDTAPSALSVTGSIHSSHIQHRSCSSSLGHAMRDAVYAIAIIWRGFAHVRRVGMTTAVSIGASWNRSSGSPV